MKKILVVYDNMMIGGTTTALLSLLNEIDYSKYEIDILFYSQKGPLACELPKNVNVLPFAYRGDRMGLNSSKQKIIQTVLNGNALKAVWYYLKYKDTPKGNIRSILMHGSVASQVRLSLPQQKCYDVAIGFLEGWSLHYVISNKVKATKKIVWIHPDYKCSYLIPEFDKKALKKADKIVTVSENCKDNIKLIFPEYTDKIILLENIMSKQLVCQRANEETKTVVNNEKFNICTVCRCDVYVKGLDRIIQSLSRLKSEGVLDNVVWHLVGDGPDMEDVKEQIKNNGLENYVVLYGNLLNPLPVLKEMDLFILASRYEGKPVSVTEALLLQIPCLVTEYAAAKEQIVSNVDGLIVDNSSEGVYQGLKLLITKKEVYAKFCENVKHKIWDNSIGIEKFNEIID